MVAKHNASRKRRYKYERQWYDCRCRGHRSRHVQCRQYARHRRQNVSGVSGALGYLTGAYGMVPVRICIKMVLVSRTVRHGVQCIEHLRWWCEFVGLPLDGTRRGAAAAGYGIKCHELHRGSEYGTREDANGHQWVQMMSGNKPLLTMPSHG